MNASLIQSQPAQNSSVAGVSEEPPVVREEPPLVAPPQPVIYQQPASGVQLDNEVFMLPQYQPQLPHQEYMEPSQRTLIEQLIATRLAQHGEGYNIVDLYQVLYPSHHQFKKLPQDITKVPKCSKFDERGSQRNTQHFTSRTWKN